MNILIPHESGGNLYIRELARAYEALGHRVTLGRENFLYLDTFYDIIHIHWPEQLYRIPYEHSNEVELAKFALNRLKTFRKGAAKCVLTMHNLMPHEEGRSKASQMICQGCYDMADLVVHHCERSIELTRSIYSNFTPQKKSIIIPHGNYFGYPNNISRREARRRLGISNDDFVFLHFGLIRAYKGLNTVIEAFKKINIKNKKLIVAGSFLGIPTLKTRFQFKWLKLTSCFNRSIFLFLKTIPNNEIQVFLKACDAVVLGHKTGLNSGVAILGMSFGRIVIGPDIGCIGEVLRKGYNIVYDPDKLDSLISAMIEAQSMQISEAQKININIAKNWSWMDMARRILDNLN